VDKLVTRKVVAYITNGNRLLVFRQPDYPNAGIQIPGGTVGHGEALDAAVLREAFEETGLDGLTLAGFLGDRLIDQGPVGKDEVHHRYYFHLVCPGAPPETWRHVETDPSEGPDQEITFEFWWAAMPDEVPALIMGRDLLLPELYQAVGIVTSAP
jgi:ADP-ribose pyrophosphatase YjhB (NUDIX family)